ncbi:MAG: ferredoxin-type protein NapG [Magnetococcales bacterium]|nr:ferredoxin-type protein NapG [Magnetococcales bacterium]
MSATSDGGPRTVAITRRGLFEQGARGAVGLGLAGLALALGAGSARALPVWAIRPPGALTEEAFLGRCLRCGLCVRSCPYDILHLAEPGSGVAPGTPYFVGRDKPCEMCPEIPCVKACPSGALDPGLTDIAKARMGLAVLADQETCLAYLGLRCEVCFQVCPLLGKAITIENRLNVRSGKHVHFLPVVHAEHCTGCGKCEKGCVLQEAAIRVLPRTAVKGALGAHYRVGWEEKKKAGHALIPEPLSLPVRRPGEGP